MGGRGHGVGTYSQGAAGVGVGGGTPTENTYVDTTYTLIPGADPDGGPGGANSPFYFLNSLSEHISRKRPGSSRIHYRCLFYI